jgi:hypothetical protein
MYLSMTENEFISKFTNVWGEDYVYDLIERGYAPVYTTHGWKWILLTNEEFANREAISADTASPRTTAT